MDKRSAPHASFAPPLFLWLLVQLLALLLAAARVPFAAGLPHNIEQLAIGEMLAVQIIASSMLFPFLLRDVNSTIAIIATSGPYLVLAGILAATPLSTMAICWAYLALWLISLAIWQAALSPSLHVAALAVANLLALGVPICLYLHAEFTARNLPNWLKDLSPLTAILDLTTGSRWIWPLWVPVAALLLMGTVLAAARRQCTHEANSH